MTALGLRQISASLKEAGWNTRLIFLPDVAELLFTRGIPQQTYTPDVITQVCDLCADLDLVGITVMSNFLGRVQALTDAIHDRLSIPVIWGGIHPTVKPQESLEWADFICVGEGEGAIVDLVEGLASAQPCADIPNIWLKDKNGNLITNPPRPLCEPLDDLPLPDYELKQEYILHQNQLVPMTTTLLAQYLLHFANNSWQTVYMIHMTRGCPYGCTYCCNNAYLEIYPQWRRLRRHSPEYVIAEINMIRKLLPDLQAITFVDDTFLAIRTDEICRFSQLYKEQVGLPFFVVTTPKTTSIEKLRCLVDAGVVDVQIGIQTGSPRVRKMYRRSETNAEIITAVNRLHQFQEAIPKPRFDLITDNPYVTYADRTATLQLLHQLPRPFKLHIFSLTLYPDTTLYRQAKADGLIQDEHQDIYHKNYLRLEPTYYNLLLLYFDRKWPQWILSILVHPTILKICSSTPFGFIFRGLWKIQGVMRARNSRKIRRQWAAGLAQIRR